MTETTQEKGTKNNRRLVIINTSLSILVSIAMLWIIREYLHINESNYTEDAQIDAFINPINTRVSAYIREIRFIEHQSVKKGDTLVILDNREIMTQLQQVEATYMNAVASKNACNSSVNTVKNNVCVVESNLEASEASLLKAEQNYKRYENLPKDDALTRQEFAQAKLEYEAQKAQHLSLLEQKKSSGLLVVEATSKLDVYATEIKRTAAMLEMAKLNFSYTIIVAPYDGIMGRRTINEGQLLQTGQQISSIVTSEKKWVTANFREKQMPNIAIGMKVTISVDALDGKEYEGIITAISQATGAKYSAIPVDNSTGNFIKVQQRIPVRIEFTEANTTADLQLLRAGMNVEIEVK